MNSTSPDLKRSAETHMRFCFAQAVDAYRGPASMRRLPGGGLRIVTGTPHPLGNFAIGAQLDEVEEVAQGLVETGMPAAFLFEGDAGADVIAKLASYGFSSVGAMPAMAVDVPRLAPAELPAECTLEMLSAKTQDPNWARAWADTFARGFDIPQELAEVFSPLNISPSQSPALHFFRVVTGTETVGVSLLALGEGVAGIYCVATVPEHRGRGIGAALTAHPLRLAQEMGFSVGVLQASEMGHPIYRRLGFEDVGKIDMYVRFPS